MHSAPAVVYPVGRSRFQGQLLGTLLALGGLAGAWWWYSVDAPGWRQGLFFAIWLLTGWISVLIWWRSPPVELAWDGAAWHGRGAMGDCAGTVRLHLDLQFFMLLCLHTDDARRLWLWPEQHSAPAVWLALRRAVVASAGNHLNSLGAEPSALLKP